MLETENLEGWKKIIELCAWSHPHEKTSFVVMLGSSTGFFSLLQEQMLPCRTSYKIKGAIKGERQPFSLSQKNNSLDLS